MGGDDFISMQPQAEERDLILAKFQGKWGARAGGEERTLLLLQAAKSSRGAEAQRDILGIAMRRAQQSKHTNSAG